MNSKNVSNNKPSFDIALAYQGFVNEPVPSSIFDAIVSGKISRVLRTAKTGLILFVGALMAVIAMSFLDKSAGDPTAALSSHELAVSAHKTFAQDNVYPVHVGVEDKAHLTDWLSYRMGKNLQIESLGNLGYTLLGGNIVPDNERVSALMIYENQLKNKLSLFIRNADGLGKDGKSNIGRQGQMNWLSWQEKGRQLVLVSELDESALQAVFDDLN